MKRTIIICLLAICCLFLSQPIMSVKAQDRIVWKINYGQSASHTYSLALQEWTRLVTDATKGRMQFELYYYSALGPQKETLEGMRLGIIHGTFSLEPLSSWVPEVNIYGVGYLFKDEAHLIRAQESNVWKVVEEKLIEAGFRPIMYHIRAPRNVTSNRPINSLNDMKGLKIRVPQGEANVKLFQALGAKPIALPFTEVIPGLRSGALDAQENPLDNIIDFKLWEVQKYVAMTEHMRQIIIVVVSEKAYQKLPEDIKQAMFKAAKIAQVNEYHRQKSEEKSYKGKIEAQGMIFTYPDQGEFRRAAVKTYDDLPQRVRELTKIVKSLE